MSFTYDEIGNPLSYYNGKSYTFTWEYGRRLATAQVGTLNLSFTYNDEGIRTSKTVNGVKHTYRLNGSRIVSEAWGNKWLIYLYDAEGAPVGMMYRNSTYPSDTFDTFWFEKNLQGDIVAVYDEDGTKLISYAYDAWGNFTTTYHNGCTASHNANLNPFRYRGYYYDAETGLYYLQSRYYDPVIGRFISADKQMPSVGGDILGYNMFAYCFNNPVNLSDTMGNWPRWVEAAAVAVSAAVLVAAVVATVAAVSAFTAGTGTPAAVYGATVLLGASLAGINGAVANTSEGDSYLNGYVGGFIGGGTQAAASILPGGNIWGGALGAGKGTAITMTLDNIDPDSSNSTFAEIAGNAASSFIKGGAMGAFTQYWSSAVGGINYFSGVVEGAVADGASGLMPTLTLGFGEGIKAFFGWLDDAMVYIWE